MTTQTLRNGDGKDLAMQPGETMLVVAVTGSYSASIIAGTGAPSIIATDATGGSYGPYAGGAVVRLRSSALSEIDWDVGTAPVVVSDTFVMASTNPLTGGIEIPDANGNPMALAGAPSKFYLACIPGRQFVTSGVPKDLSSNAADAVFGSALIMASTLALS